MVDGREEEWVKIRVKPRQGFGVRVSIEFGSEKTDVIVNERYRGGQVLSPPSRRETTQDLSSYFSRVV